LPRLARLADYNKLVVFGNIDTFHDCPDAKDLRLERQMKAILRHRVDAGHLFRFAICVGQRIIDVIVKARLGRLKVFG
jgi:hypothetical protein